MAAQQKQFANHTQTHTHTDTHTQTGTDTHTQAHTRTHTHTHKHTHTQTHTDRHRHTHRHTRIQTHTNHTIKHPLQNKSPPIWWPPGRNDTRVKPNYVSPERERSSPHNWGSPRDLSPRSNGKSRGRAAGVLLSPDSHRWVWWWCTCVLAGQLMP